MLKADQRALSIINLLAVCFLLARLYIAYIQPLYLFVDDLTYMSAAIHMLTGVQCAPVAGNACNYEHPPLAKLFAAAGFAIFGKVMTVSPQPGITGVAANQFAGRYFSIVMASVMAPIIYLVVTKMSGNWRMAFISSLFVLVDPLLFTLSDTAGIDVTMVFFAFLALIPYVYKLKLGPINHFYLTGLVLGLSVLAKETAIFVIAALVSFVVIAGDGSLKSRIVGSTQILIGMALVFALGLQVYDSLMTPFPTFLSQIEEMASFHFGAGPTQVISLVQYSNCTAYPGLCPNNFSLVPHFLYSHLPLSFVPSYDAEFWAGANPLDFLTYLPPIAFATALVLVVNYPLVWMSYVWTPLVVWKLGKRQIGNEEKPVLLAALILIWNTVSNVYVYSFLGRNVFEWYLLPVVPAFAIGGAYIVTRQWMPKWAFYALLVVCISVGLLLTPIAYHIFFPKPQVCTSC